MSDKRLLIAIILGVSCVPVTVSMILCIACDMDGTTAVVILNSYFAFGLGLIAKGAAERSLRKKDKWRS